MEVYGADLLGIDGKLVRFKAMKELNRKGVSLLGLLGKVVKEGFARASKAIETLEGTWNKVLESQGYTIQLEPSETPKNSPGLDLPLAVMILYASVLQKQDDINDEIKDIEIAAQKPSISEEKKRKLLQNLKELKEKRALVLKYRKRLQNNKNKYLMIGTLSITDGKISPPEHGMFGLISCAKKGSIVIIPEESECHGALIARGRKDITIYIAQDLQEVWDIVLQNKKPREASYKKNQIITRKIIDYIPDLNAIDGLSVAKRAMEIAIAGGHNILLTGPPGEGKTMLAKSSMNLLPEPLNEEIYEINKIYSARGDLQDNEIFLDRPFQEAQTNTTEAALLGGGRGQVLPGLVSLAHHGILFFDEINLCNPSIIEKLRNTLNDRKYILQRSGTTLEYPCDFIFIAAMNPCKCGWYGYFKCHRCKRIFWGNNNRCSKHPDDYLVPKCGCKKSEVSKYLDKLSKPLLDRIDLKVNISPYQKGSDNSYSYATSTIRKKIQEARKVQANRYKSAPFGLTNSSVPDRSQFKEFNNTLKEDSFKIYQIMKRKYELTKRTEVKLLLVSQTIADLESKRFIMPENIEEAATVMGIKNYY